MRPALLGAMLTLVTIFFARFHRSASRWSDFNLVAIQDISVNLGILVRYNPHVETLYIVSALLN